MAVNSVMIYPTVVLPLFQSVSFIVIIFSHFIHKYFSHRCLFRRLVLLSASAGTIYVHFTWR